MAHKTLSEFLAAQPEGKLIRLQRGILAEIAELRAELDVVDEALARKAGLTRQEGQTREDFLASYRAGRVVGGEEER